MAPENNLTSSDCWYAPELLRKRFINNAPCSEKTRRSRIAFASMRDVLYGKVSFRQHLRFFRLFYPAWSVDIEEELIKSLLAPRQGYRKRIERNAG
jgi:ABC-type multidrug transport system ATPase subunit